jgi:hypothetical protein
VTLDERLAGAAEALRRSVRRDAPPFEVIRRRARRRRVVGAGIGLVAVVGAVGAVGVVFALVPFGGSGGGSGGRSGGGGSTVYGAPGPKTGGGEQAPCLSVAANDGTSIAGCELVTDAKGGTARLDELTARYGGVPVYRDGSARQQVGVLTPDLGFVPRELVPQLAELRVCWSAVQAMLADPERAPLDAHCRGLMVALGYPESFLEGKG